MNRILMVLGVVAVIGCGFLFFWWLETGLEERRATDRPRAEETARAFAARLHLPLTAVECESLAWDGVVRCTFVLQQPDGSVRVEPMLCWREAHLGCRSNRVSGL